MTNLKIKNKPSIIKEQLSQSKLSEKRMKKSAALMMKRFLKKSGWKKKE